MQSPIDLDMYVYVSLIHVEFYINFNLGSDCFLYSCLPKKFVRKFVLLLILFVIKFAVFNESCDS